eukprot:5339008-Amphidinium_carterae.5
MRAVWGFTTLGQRTGKVSPELSKILRTCQLSPRSAPLLFLTRNHRSVIKTMHGYHGSSSVATNRGKRKGVVFED